ncbi:hypothetical protein FM105_00825 [Brevibacterium yomogidense]|uniref:Uncharacterized protein n=1 Tax=Brevibacterium yomogidense TaxID=946573 RepID=A0A1X6WU73_9MICO|nr:hypothetical protein FM105_00825 [Brevibacterium yomogidense]
MPDPSEGSGTSASVAVPVTAPGWEAMPPSAGDGTHAANG